MKIVQFLLSPIAFAIGFLTPLLAQLMLAAGWIDMQTNAYLIAFIVAMALGLMAQFRGSWIWLRS